MTTGAAALCIRIQLRCGGLSTSCGRSINSIFFKYNTDVYRIPIFYNAIRGYMVKLTSWSRVLRHAVFRRVSLPRRQLPLSRPSRDDSLFVEPHVFEAPAIVLAVGHYRQPLDLGLPAGRGAQVIDDRARQILLQFIIGVPREPFALARIGFHRLL